MLGLAALLRAAIMAAALGVAMTSETCDKSRGETCQEAAPAGSELLGCGSCYGAESSDRPCCESCKDVQDAYRAKSWGWPGNNAIAQCRNGAAQTVQIDPSLPCGAHRGCDSCLAANCAWCIGSRRFPACSVAAGVLLTPGDVKMCGRQGVDVCRRLRTGLLCTLQSNFSRRFCRAEQRLAERQQLELERLRGENVEAGEKRVSTIALFEVHVDKKEAVDEEEIKRRAANFGDGQKDPYGVLKLPKDSQMTDIRKAYRSRQVESPVSSGQDLRRKAEGGGAESFHGCGELASHLATVLGSLSLHAKVAAYEILGDPEKRAAYDDLGGQDQAQFNTFWEWEMYGKKESSNDFYNGETLISKLTESLWPRRVIGDAIWLVEFYAPWCTACGHFVNTYKTIAKALENDDIEVYRPVLEAD
eukprot:758314-Hanusia_phi.AAC.1